MKQLEDYLYYEEKDPDLKIYHGDCLEIMPLLPKVDLVVTDPPYGLKNAETEKNIYDIYDDDEIKTVSMVSKVIAQFQQHRLVLTPGQKLMFRYPEPTAVGAFFYPAGSGSCSWGFVGWQPIFYYGKDPYLQKGMGRAMNSFSSTEQAERWIKHPCPKPITQWKKLIKRASLDGESILDPFLGSGTTLVACKELNRNGIGIEISEKYCEIAKKRLKATTKSLF